MALATNRTVSRRLISLAEAAEMLGFTPKTIRRFVATGALPAYRIGRKHIRVDEADVLALVHRIPTVEPT